MPLTAAVASLLLELRSRSPAVQPGHDPDCAGFDPFLHPRDWTHLCRWCTRWWFRAQKLVTLLQQRNARRPLPPAGTEGSSSVR